VRRIEDRPEHHEAPGAWEWDEQERRRRDARASRAADRFLDASAVAEDCWRCEAASSTSRVGLCETCLADLRGGLP
jgi:hypothetical protein